MRAQVFTENGFAEPLVRAALHLSGFSLEPWSDPPAACDEVPSATRIALSQATVCAVLAPLCLLSRSSPTIRPASETQRHLPMVPLASNVGNAIRTALS